jgi:hypothetical protein
MVIFVNLHIKLLADCIDAISFLDRAQFETVLARSTLSGSRSLAPRIAAGIKV